MGAFTSEAMRLPIDPRTTDGFGYIDGNCMRREPGTHCFSSEPSWNDLETPVKSIEEGFEIFDARIRTEEADTEHGLRRSLIAIHELAPLVTHVLSQVYDLGKGSRVETGELSGWPFSFSPYVPGTCARKLLPLYYTRASFEIHIVGLPC
eukprot:jgi/Botrbrau1/6048/Bobra.0042s0031.1